MVKVNPVTEEMWSRFCKIDAKARLSMQETPVRKWGRGPKRLGSSQCNSKGMKGRMQVELFNTT